MPDPNTWAINVIETKQELEKMQLTNYEPKTVGEYFQQILRK